MGKWEANGTREKKLGTRKKRWKKILAERTCEGNEDERKF